MNCLSPIESTTIEEWEEYFQSQSELDWPDPFPRTPLEKSIAYTNPGLPRNPTETSE